MSLSKSFLVLSLGFAASLGSTLVSVTPAEAQGVVVMRPSLSSLATCGRSPVRGAFNFRCNYRFRGGAFEGPR